MQRPLSHADLPSLLAVLNAREEADGVPLRTPIDDLEEDLRSPGLELATDSVGVFDAAGSCVAYGFVWRAREATPQFHSAKLHLVVGPDQEGRGLGRQLLDQLVDRARAMLALAKGTETPKLVTAGIDQRQAAARTLLSSSGFDVLRYFDELAAPLGGDQIGDLPSRPDDIELIDWDPLRSREAKGVMRGAFADHWGSTPVSEARWQSMTAPPRFQPDLSTMAVRPDPQGNPELEAVVGLLLVQRWPEADGAGKEVKSADIDVVAVSRSARRKGIATAMLVRTLRRCRERGFTCATLGVDSDSQSGAHDLYQRLGFEPTTRLEIWGLDVTPSR